MTMTCVHEAPPKREMEWGVAFQIQTGGHVRGYVSMSVRCCTAPPIFIRSGSVRDGYGKHYGEHYGGGMMDFDGIGGYPAGLRSGNAGE